MRSVPVGGLCVVIGQKREACTFVECYASPCEVVGRQFYFKHNGATVGPVENFKRAGAVVATPQFGQDRKMLHIYESFEIHNVMKPTGVSPSFRIITLNRSSLSAMLRNASSGARSSSGKASVIRRSTSPNNSLSDVSIVVVFIR